MRPALFFTHPLGSALPIWFAERALSLQPPSERAFSELVERLFDWLATKFPQRLTHAKTLYAFEQRYRDCLIEALASWPYHVEPRLRILTPRPRQTLPQLVSFCTLKKDVPLAFCKDDNEAIQWLQPKITERAARRRALRASATG